MDKKKREQIILIVLIPAFLISVIYMRSVNKKSATTGTVKVTSSSNMKLKSIDSIPKPKPPSDIKYEAGPRDPLKNIFKLYVQELQKKISTGDAKDIPLPKLNIEGLVWNSDMPQAIINDKVVRIGDTIEGVEVVKIEKKGVTIKYSGAEVLVPRK